MPSQSVIEMHKLTKFYGKTVGVENISLKVPKGSVYGFLGPNGAGKTTTINMLVNFIKPTKGSVKIFRLDSVNDSLQIHRKIGFLAGDFNLDKSFTGWQQLEYYGKLRGEFDRKYIKQLAGRLNCNLNIKFKNLSRGNKQKVGLISALMHKPQLLIFDEPTTGLDPLIQAEFNKIILEQKKNGVTTFISSHVLSEVQEICDRVAFIRQGKLVDAKPLSEIIGNAAHRVIIDGISKSDAKKLTDTLNIEKHSFNKSKLDFMYGGDMQKLIKELAKYKLKDLAITETNLESVFMSFYEDDDA